MKAVNRIQTRLILALVIGSLFAAPTFAEPHFRNPQAVAIDRLPMGFGRQALSTEEPFISRDGRFLFFNSHKHENNKDLHYAEQHRGRWVYRGEIGPQINTAKEVEGNPSMDRDYRFYYVNSGIKHMVSVGSFEPRTGTLTDIREFTALPQRKVRLIGQKVSGNMGVEVSDDGDTVFFSRATWDLNLVWAGRILASDLMLASKKNSRFVYDESESKRILSKINTDELEYAASISADGLELFFTRLYRKDIGKNPVSRIMRASRKTTRDPFQTPETITAIGTEAFVEGPAISADGRELYYHKLVNGKFKLYKVRR